MSESILAHHHQHFMQRCLQLASKGLGSTYPNPLVGSVIVLDGKIIGEGWHKKAGNPHAEVNAINNVKDINQLSNATLYVNLEPCCHFGKTPPCTNLIIEHKIKNVVIGSLDPNPKVAGKGVQLLQETGCNVLIGVLEKEATWLNRRFFTSVLQQRPFIILKWAASNDGFISPSKREKTAPVWITGKASRQVVHRWRSEEQAILVGINTVLVDNPSLTTRLVEGNSPHRFVIDPQNKTPLNAAILNDQAATTIVSNSPFDGIESFKNIDWVASGDSIIKAIINHAKILGIQSLIIEGGAYTLQQFIDSGFWDEARIFTGKDSFKSGVSAPKIKGIVIDEQTIDNDSLKIMVPTPEDI